MGLALAWQPACSETLSLTVPDPYQEEERWRTIGKPSSESSLLLFVVHTWPDEKDTGRIISARETDPHERKAYEEGKF